MGTGFNTCLLTTVFQQTICQVRSLLRMLLCKWRMVCACQVAMSTPYKRENSITLTHHTLLEIPSFPFLKPLVCKHIPHQYSKGMARKSQMVLHITLSKTLLFCNSRKYPYSPPHRRDWTFQGETTLKHPYI